MSNNRWKIRNYDLQVGQFVRVDFVRSNILDTDNGIGWFAHDVVVVVSKVMDLTFCFEFNGQLHYGLKNDVHVVNKAPKDNIELNKILYASNDFYYRMKMQYGI